MRLGAIVLAVGLYASSLSAQYYEKTERHASIGDAMFLVNTQERESMSGWLSPCPKSRDLMFVAQTTDKRYPAEVRLFDQCKDGTLNQIFMVYRDPGPEELQDVKNGKRAGSPFACYANFLIDEDMPEVRLGYIVKCSGEQQADAQMIFDRLNE